MSDADMIHRLKAMQESYDAAPQVRLRDPLQGIEDDDYQGRVEAWEMFPGKKNPDALYLKMMASIQHHPEHQGREVPFLFDVTDPDKLGFLKDHFWNLGITELDMTQLAPGSELLNSLLDVPILIGVYTNKKGYRDVVVRQRLDGEQHSDLGTAQQQIQGFEKNEAPKANQMQTAGQMAATAERMHQKATKPDACICPDPGAGQFDENCPVPGHGINF